MAGRGSRDLGDKLGPKLVDLAVAATLATRRGLAPHEAKVRQVATQALIDRAGHEVADLYAPLLADFLAREGIHPDLRQHVASAASGQHQWQAIAGFAFGASGGGNVIATILGNEVAPLVYDAVRSNPHLIPDLGTIAELYARGIINQGNAWSSSGALGYHSGWIDDMAKALQVMPSADQVNELLNHGLINGPTADTFLQRSGVPAGLYDTFKVLRRKLLSPQDAALAVLRNNIDHATGYHIASINGLDNADFDILLNNTGEPLGLMQLLEAYRRGFISQSRLKEGILQSRIRPEWINVAEALRYSPVPTADAIDAAQRGRISQAEAAKIAAQNGVEPGQVPILVANAGNPPSPEQLLELWRRGFINEAAVNRGLLEGRTKDEWIPQIRDLRYQPISTADAIDAWQRGHITQAQATVIAEQNGAEPSQVKYLLANAGNPLALEQLLEAFRRKIITEAQMKDGIRQGRLRNDWIDAAVALRYSPMSTADAVTASVQGQLPKAAAKAIAEENGLRPADFEPLWQTAGAPLARTELQQLYNRGNISLATYQQGLRESRLKDKYVNNAVQLHVRLPEPRVVTEALADGVISAATAAKMLAEDGYSPAVTTMLTTLGTIRSTGPYRQLMTGEISALYADRMIDEQAALKMLTKLHYQEQTAVLILTLADYKRDQRIRDSAISAIRAHYLAYRTDELTTSADLAALLIPPDTVDLYLQVWTLERLDHPKQLTALQLVKAATKNLFVDQGDLTADEWAQANQDEGKKRLVQFGYSEDDALLLLAGA
jgi:hypothetical protein